MKKNSHFIAPKLNHALVSVFDLFSPLYVNATANLSVEIEPSVQEAFEAIAATPAIICPNHGTAEDVYAVFELARQVHQQFHFLTTREIFRWHPSLRSTWLQSLGCYSILRADPDVQSFRSSRQLLTSGPNKLLIFPEGEISRCNHALLPLEAGVLHLALQAQREYQSRGLDQAVTVLPIAIRYTFNRDESATIREVLMDSEDYLGLSANGRPSQRLRECFKKMLAVQEAEHNLSTAPGETIEQRISRLSKHLVHHLATRYQVDTDQHVDLIDQLHILKNRLTERRYCHGIEPSEQVRHDYRSIVQLSALLGISDHSFESPMPQEHAYEMLGVLAIQLGKQLEQLPKVAHIAAAEPLNMTALSIEPKNYRKADVVAISSELQLKLQDTMHELVTRHPSLVCLP